MSSLGSTLGESRQNAATGPTLSALAEDDRLESAWARSDEEVRAAQRLRWRVFAEEMGARLRPPPQTPEGHDADLFDAHCEHLIVRTVPVDGRPAEVVGTYRVLTPDAARLVGGLYADSEFDLVRLRPLRPTMVELGRSCIDPRWRTGGVIFALWRSLAVFMLQNGFERAVGCASVPMRDGGHLAANLWHALRATHLAPPQYQVRPRLPLPVEQLRTAAPVEAPPLIKGYLRCGARVLGPPAWDPDFGTADLPLMLTFSDVSPSYRRRFLEV